MKKLTFVFILMLQLSVSYAQKKYHVSPYVSVESFLTRGNITNNTAIIDGYAKNGSSNNFGIDIALSKSVGIVLEFSRLGFNTEGRVEAFEELTDSYNVSAANLTFSQEVRGLEQWNFFIPKIGISYSYQLKKSQISAVVKLGGKFGSSDLSSSSNISFGNPYYSLQYRGNDFLINTEAGTGNGWVVDFDLLYRFKPFANERVELFGGIGIRKGSIQNGIKEEINLGSSESSIAVSQDMEFQTYGLKFGMSYDLF